MSKETWDRDPPFSNELELILHQKWINSGFVDSIIPFFLGVSAPWEWMGKGGSGRSFMASDEDGISSFSREKLRADVTAAWIQLTLSTGGKQRPG